MGIVANTPKEEEATVGPWPQREHRRREGCLPQGGLREKKQSNYGSLMTQQDLPGGDRSPQ